MNGAIQAGTRSANEILEKLYPDFIYSSEDTVTNPVVSLNSSRGKSWKLGVLSTFCLITGVLVMAIHWF